jgi:hypothetical protein
MKSEDERSKMSWLDNVNIIIYRRSPGSKPRGTS